MIKMPFFKSKTELDYLIEIIQLLQHDKKKLTMAISSSSSFKFEIQARAEVINELLIKFHRSMDNVLLNNSENQSFTNEKVLRAFVDSIRYTIKILEQELERPIDLETREDFVSLISKLMLNLGLSSQNATPLVTDDFHKQVIRNQILSDAAITKAFLIHKIRARLIEELQPPDKKNTPDKLEQDTSSLESRIKNPFNTPDTNNTIEISDKLAQETPNIDSMSKELLTLLIKCYIRETPEKLAQEIIKLGAIYTKVFELIESDAQNLINLFKDVNSSQYHELFKSFSETLQDLPQESLDLLKTHDNGKLGFFSKLIRLIEQALGLSTRSEKNLNHLKKQLNQLNETSTKETVISEPNLKK